MPGFFAEIIVFSLSSGVAFYLIYSKAPTTTILQIITILVVVLLISLNRFLLNKNKSLSGFFRNLVLLLSSLFVQLIVLSSGGFFSPFLILIHLFTLGSGFLLDLFGSILFLVLTLVILALSTIFNPRLALIFQQDPGSVFLYIASFVVIVPLGIVLMRTYNLKNTLTKFLKDYIQFRELREDSILKSLSEWVVVTDFDLNILFVNEAVEQSLGMSSAELVHQSLIDVFLIQNKDGSLVKIEDFGIDRMLLDKTARIVSSYLIKLKSQAVAERVVFQLRPITDLAGKVNQILFVITDVNVKSDYYQLHGGLKLANFRNQALKEELRQAMLLIHEPMLRSKIELFSKNQEDLITAIELEDHQIQPKIVFEDIALLCKKVVAYKQILAQSLAVNLKMILPPEEAAEAALLRMNEMKDLPSSSMPVSDFGIFLDSFWFEVIIKKVLDIAILLVSEQVVKNVEVILHREGRVVVVTVAIPYMIDSSVLQKNIFVQYYGDLGLHTGLRQGSGLEGFIAKTVSEGLSIPIYVHSEKYSPNLTFQIRLTKDHH